MILMRALLPYSFGPFALETAPDTVELKHRANPHPFIGTVAFLTEQIIDTEFLFVLVLIKVIRLMNKTKKREQGEAGCYPS